MGQGMTRNVAKAGMTVHAWNRSREKAQPLADEGITVVDSPTEAVDGADIVLTILSDGDAVHEVAQQFLPAVADDTIWLQMSTIGQRATDRCIELAREHGVGFVDAPVLGTKKPAEDGTLVVLASGADELRERVEPIFEAVGQRTMWVGEAGQGSRLKVVVNSWIVSVVEGTAETIALAQGMGIDPKLFLEAVSGGGLDMPYLQMKAGMMIDREFEPSFSLKLAAKDARLAVEAAQDAGVQLPMLAAIAEQMTTGADEHGDEDLSATYLVSAPSQQPAAR
jgi:3-hydroxyisobutyrate dehydrogenase